jgi:hypothetical protein
VTKKKSTIVLDSGWFAINAKCLLIGSKGGFLVPFEGS